MDTGALSSEFVAGRYRASCLSFPAISQLPAHEAQSNSSVLQLTALPYIIIYSSLKPIITTSLVLRYPLDH